MADEVKNAVTEDADVEGQRLSNRVSQPASTVRNAQGDGPASDAEPKMSDSDDDV